MSVKKIDSVEGFIEVDGPTDFGARYLHLRELQGRVDSARAELASARAAFKAAVDALRR